MRAVRLAAAVGGLAALLACAPKAPVVPVAGPPRFPEFVSPLGGAPIAPQLAEILQGGWVQLQAGNLSAADRAFTRALRQSPSDPSALAAAGYAALARDDIGRAVSRFDESIAAAPQFAAALAGRGEALLRLNRSVEALESFEAAVAADPALPLATRIETLRFRALEDTLGRARRHAAAGEWDLARGAYETALKASPDSAVLFRELAAVERRTGHIVEADAHLERAIALDPGDRASRVLLAQTREESGDYDGAIASYEAALAIEPSSEIEAALTRVRERADLARLPEQFQALGERAEATRADLAAAIAIRLPGLLARAPARATPVLTDIRGTWARPWIMTTVRSGILEPFPNHTFQPAAPVRRADVAVAVSRVLQLLAAQGDRRGADWQAATPSFADLPPSHPAYRAAAVADAAGVMHADGGLFRPNAGITGREVLEAVARLQRLAGPLAGRPAH
jgi:tetratricopeptide (TPR) repeat protein